MAKKISLQIFLRWLENSMNLVNLAKKNKLGVMYLAKTELLNMKIEDIQI